MIGASLRAIKVAEDRLWFKDACRKIGLEVPASALVNNAQDALRLCDQLGFPAGDSSIVHAGRDRRLHRLQPRRIWRSDFARAGYEPGTRSAGGRIGAGLEGIRARSDARLPRQFRGHLHDREFRSHGRAHRRFHHRGARADAYRQGIPAHARCRGGDYPRSGRRDRRSNVQFAVEPGERQDDRDRDESARFAQFGAGQQGDRVSRSPKLRRDWPSA